MSALTNAYADRDIRQREIVPPAKLAASHALVVGVGAIGRQVALQLAAMGVPALDLVDHDTVGVENLAPQGYWPADIGKNKVNVTAALLANINPDLSVAAHADRFKRSSPKTLASFDLKSARAPIVFACVDDMDTRRMIWETVRGRARFFVDARMSAETLRVLAVGFPAMDRYYATTLFAHAEALVGSCTAKSTIYTASIAAGLMVGQFTKWLRGLPVERDLSLNLLAAELVCQ